MLVPPLHASCAIPADVLDAVRDRVALRDLDLDAREVAADLELARAAGLEPELGGEA